MGMKTSILLALMVLSAIPLTAGEKKDKLQRGMVEKMEAVSCGARQKGVTGFGAIWASVGITSVNSKENLCPQYLVRTDTNEYEVRPTDSKHPDVLPIGHEGQFKIKKDHMLLTMGNSDGGDRKTRVYQVVSVKPTAPLDSQDTDVKSSANER